MVSNTVENIAIGAGSAAATYAAVEAWRRASERTVLDGKTVRSTRVDAARLSADADTFQFKSGGDRSGVTDRLAGVKTWNAAAAGKVMVYEYADGRQVIADGHQRTGLAKRLMSDGHAPIKMDALVLREADGWSPRDVRAYAAIKNMHESSGNALDMAKIMRERPDLVTSSLPMSDAKVREASALSRLSDKAFGMVVGGGVEPGAAAAVGEAVKDATRHADMIAEMSEAKVRGAQHARLYVQQALSAPSVAETTSSLFGEETHTRSLIKERSAVLDRALTSLKSNRKLFGMLEREADTIEAAGNKLARQANSSNADTAGRLSALVEKLATQRGNVSKMLDDAARAVASGEPAAKAGRAFLKSVQGAMEQGGIRALVGDAPLPMAASGGMQRMVDKPIAVVRVEEAEGTRDVKRGRRTVKEQVKTYRAVREVDGFFEATVPTTVKGEAEYWASRLEVGQKPMGAQILRGTVDDVYRPGGAWDKARKDAASQSLMVEKPKKATAKTAARQVYREMSGSAPDPRWSAKELAKRIELRRVEIARSVAMGEHIDAMYGVKRQTSFLPPATTQEQVSAVIKSAGKPAVAQLPADDGLFGSSMKQTDLVDMAKQPAGWSDEARAASAEVRAAKAEPRGMDGLTRSERNAAAGKAAKPVAQAADGASTLEKFRATYEKTLAEQVKANPGKYAYGIDRVPDMARRMTDALASGGGDTTSPTVQAVAKALNIKPTVGGIRAALNDQPPPAPAPRPQKSPLEKAEAAHVKAEAERTRAWKQMQSGAIQGPQYADISRKAEAAKKAFEALKPSTAVAQAPSFDQGVAPIKDADGNAWRKHAGSSAWSVDHTAKGQAAPVADSPVARISEKLNASGVTTAEQAYKLFRSDAELASKVKSPRAGISLVDYVAESSATARTAAMYDVAKSSVGWSDAAREAAAEARGVAKPGEAKAKPKTQPMIGDKKLAVAAGMDAGNRSMRAAGRTQWNADDANAATEARAKVMGETKPKARAKTAPKAVKPGSVADLRAQAKAAKAPPVAQLRADAARAGIPAAAKPRVDVAAIAARVEGAIKSGDKALIHAVQAELAATKFSKADAQALASKTGVPVAASASGKKAMQMVVSRLAGMGQFLSKIKAVGGRGVSALGPAAIIGAGAVAFDATRNQAHAAGKSESAANLDAAGAAAIASGSVAAIGYGIGKVVQAAARVAPVAGKVLSRAVPLAALGAAAYEIGGGAIAGFKKDGLAGAAKGAGVGAMDFATLGAYSHFANKGQMGRLTPEQEAQFSTADQGYRAGQEQQKAAAATDDSSGWTDQARIAAYMKRIANAGGTPQNMPYGGKPRQAPASSGTWAQASVSVPSGPAKGKN